MSKRKAPQKIPQNVTCLLFVEGAEDKQFFIKLGEHLGFTDETPLYIWDYEGVDNLSGALASAMLDPLFPLITHMGIVRDADYEGTAFQSVITAIENANRAGRDNHRELPVPQSVQEFYGEHPKLMVLVLPDVNQSGMLEDVILASFADDPVMRCVDDYFACFTEAGIQPIANNIPKAKVRVFIAGKNADAQQSIEDDRKKGYVSDIFSMTWWRDEHWMHPAFDSAKAFLRQLAAV